MLLDKRDTVRRQRSPVMVRLVVQPDGIAGSSLLMRLLEAAGLATDLVHDVAWLASHAQVHTDVLIRSCSPTASTRFVGGAS